jgi:hypothetical protein
MWKGRMLNDRQSGLMKAFIVMAFGAVFLGAKEKPKPK